MAIGIETNFVIYNQQFWGGVIETLQQNTEAFNAASQQWAKRNVEGACFVVERSEESKARWHAVGTPDNVHALGAGTGLRSIASSS